MTTVVIGGTAGLGLEVARHRAAEGDSVVISGRDADRAAAVAKSLDGDVRGIAVELGDVRTIAAACGEVGAVDHLVLAAIDRDENTVRDYDLDRALRLATMKLVGYTEVVHTLLPAMHERSAVVVFGGRAKDRPYAGSLTVSTVNGGVTGMVNAMVTELAPIRVNAIHPGVVGDSPYWSAKPAAVLDGIRGRTPTGRLVAMADIVGAVDFLLLNQSVNGVQLYVDGGTLLT
jgi:NAD(P)-dependent dehydrogenase (short-subunit alcohol dehydrogenase family)